MLGKPLIAYTIEAALHSGVFSRVLVSTDDAEIAAIARTSGAEVPELRPSRLADDVTPVSAVTADVVNRLLGEPEPDLSVCQLMPNCPLRDAADIVASREQFLASGTRAQLSVVRFGWQNPWWAMKRGEGFHLEPLFPQTLTARSQDLPDLFCPTGAVWWARGSALVREGTFYAANHTGWEIDWRHGLDIDTPDDWELTEAVMRSSRFPPRGRDDAAGPSRPGEPG